MAQSPSHKFGQIIGDTLQSAFEPPLRAFCRSHKLYLDKKGKRKARPGLKLSIKDKYGNSHDLDYVIERYGTTKVLGSPVAFIEIAWRRYTKHSRNKAQEIQGSILPLLETYRNNAPFIGVVLAGEFTSSALEQLRSHGFKVLYFPYELIISIFKKYGIDADYSEDTPDKDFIPRIAAWNAIDSLTKKKIEKALLNKKRAEFIDFMESLRVSVTREIKQIIIVPLYGDKITFPNIEASIKYISELSPSSEIKNLYHIEIYIYYSNNDSIIGRFKNQSDAINFLGQYKASAAL